jgi:L-threonylcarbamoyladenylate synthase
MPITDAINVLRAGGIIAYPTESVFGLGCDPDNESAVKKILHLKQRDIAKGLIIIASDIQQLELYIEHDALTNNPSVLNSWPGPHTWLLPYKPGTPLWLTGNHKTLAARITAHPIATEICKQFGKAIVSTSANISDCPPALTADEVRTIFADEAIYTVEGNTEGHAAVTTITDAVTGKQLR